MKKIILFCTTLPILFFSCQVHKESGDLRNTAAAIPAQFNFDQPGLHVLASFVYPAQGTMSTLYGKNEGTADRMRVLVTWKQEADPRWFGARIPGALNSIEVVKQSKALTAYDIYEGSALIPATDKVNNMSRANYILSLQASVMP